MGKILFLLFFPSIVMIFAAFIIWLVLVILVNIWEFLFGTHEILIMGDGKTIYETRLNRNNKLVNSWNECWFNEYCGHIIPPELNQWEVKNDEI